MLDSETLANATSCRVTLEMARLGSYAEALATILHPACILPFVPALK